MDNLIKVDFTKTNEAANDVNKEIAGVRLSEQNIKANIKALMLSIMDECTQVLAGVEDFEHGKEKINFIDFFDEALRNKLELIQDAQDRLHGIGYKVDLLTEEIERTNLGAFYGFLYE